MKSKTSKVITLFKKDSKDNIRVWKIWTKGAKLMQEAGLLDGELVPHEKLCKSKNISKANETTPGEQAILEMESKIREKLQEDYFRTKSEAESEDVLLPMLAKSYKDHKDKIDWDNDIIFVQRKYDGMRCISYWKDNRVILMSRAGVEITTMDHLKSELELIVKDGTILDGELFILNTSFQETMKLIKKYISGGSDKIQYYIYDIVSNMNFNDRFDKLCSILD